jgi:excinuclease ABC subunit C
MKEDAFDPRKLLPSLPHKPGIYQYFDEAGEIIYIGKAKDLRNRVASYFNNEQINAKTKILVRKIRDIKFTIVDTEIDAWLLENSLIKKYKPRYNVLLKDDKTYPSLVIKKERFPRIFPTRNIVRDGSTYLGPYASPRMMYTIFDLIKALYPLRTCSYLLSSENIEAGKFKVCLEYQIGNCLGPCQNFQTEEDYAQNIKEIKEILKGNIQPILQMLKASMKNLAENMQFEKANLVKEKIEALENYQSKSTVVSSNIDNVDVFSISSDERVAFVNYLKVNKGTISQTQTIEIRKKLEESDEELLSLAIIEFREKFESTAKELVLPFELPSFDDSVRIVVPKQGDKKNLLDLSLKNVLFFKKQKLDQYEKVNPNARAERILSQLQKDLRLRDLPVHMECFDNSNFQGKYPVSAIVVFKDGKPSKKDYRHFNVKTVEGPNDFATMEEAVYRRYHRLIEEGTTLPQLIVIDGGKGQLSSAVSSLKKLGIDKKVAIIGIAKRLEEIYYPGDSLPLYIDKKSESLKLIQFMRDEAHRFGITFHRKKRNKGTLQSELEQVPGIGKTTIEKLLLKFKSVKKIKEASQEELATVLNVKQLISFNEYIEGIK